MESFIVVQPSTDVSVAIYIAEHVACKDMNYYEGGIRTTVMFEEEEQ